MSGHTSILKTILLQFCPGDLFVAISTLLGSPIIGAFLLMEASGLGGDHRIGSAEQPTAAAGADTDLVPG